VIFDVDNSSYPDTHGTGAPQKEVWGVERGRGGLLLRTTTKETPTVGTEKRYI